MFSRKTKTNRTRGTESFGNQPQKYHYDVIYLMEPLTASEAMIIVTTKQGVDEVFVGPDVLYCSRLTARATQSHLARIVALPVLVSVWSSGWLSEI